MTNFLNKINAWQRGQNPWLNVETDDGKAKFKRVRANDYFGNPRANWCDPKKKEEKSEDN